MTEHTEAIPTRLGKTMHRVMNWMLPLLVIEMVWVAYRDAPPAAHATWPVAMVWSLWPFIGLAILWLWYHGAGDRSY